MERSVGPVSNFVFSVGLVNVLRGVLLNLGSFRLREPGRWFPHQSPPWVKPTSHSLPVKASLWPPCPCFTQEGGSKPGGAQLAVSELRFEPWLSVHSQGWLLHFSQEHVQNRG